MHEDGSLMNRDTDLWWAPRLPAVGDSEAVLDLVAAATALRRGRGRDFLVTGRMLTFANVEGIAERAWEDDGRVHRIPAVFHASWQAPGGRFLARARQLDRRRATRANVRDPRLGTAAHLTVSDRDGQRTMRIAEPAGVFALALPARSCVLLEAATDAP